MAKIVRTDPKLRESLRVPPIPKGIARDDPTPPQPPRDWRKVPRPDRIARLPISRRNGYPIFYSVQPWPPLDVQLADFQHMFHERIAACAAENLCGICGERLDYWIWFAGGPVSCGTRWFTDPPMHRDCLEYAWLVCPYLLRGGFVRPEADAEAARKQHNDYKLIVTNPDRLGLYRTRSYRFPAKDGSLGFEAAAPKEIIWRTNITAHWKGSKSPQSAPYCTEGMESVYSLDFTVARAIGGKDSPDPDTLAQARADLLGADVTRRLDEMYGDTPKDRG